MKSFYQLLVEQLSHVVQALYPYATAQIESIGGDVTPSTDPKFGDYQYNGAMKLAKIAGKPPREIAAALVHEYTNRFAADGLMDRIEIAGPGFINFTISPAAVASTVQLMAADQQLGAHTAKRQRVIVDFSSPNIAKEMHVGHLRSTIIGDAIARLFEFLGHDVLRLNHLGDWGTAFGMLIAYIREHQQDALHRESITLTELVTWYRAAKAQFDVDPEFKKRSQLAVVQLQGGEHEALEIWRKICAISQKAYQEIYDLLDIKLIDRGESFYNPFLPEIIEHLAQQGVLGESEGAKVVFIDGFVTREGELLPLIVQKSDAGYNYATTDLAALKHRIGVEKADRIIYVTDAGQAQHFQMIFAAAQKAGILDHAQVKVHHVPFGLVLGSDGKKFKTRSGDTERLMDLLDAAIERAYELIKEKNPTIAESELQDLARKLGIAALKYADLSSHRANDYVFSYERMLRFDGNTAPFIIYSYVRTQAILRKIGGAVSVNDTDIVLVHPSERALALRLVQFSEALTAMERELLPNRLTDYLYALASDFNAFFRDCRVEGDVQQDSRAALVALTGTVLKAGLQILGISTVERM